ncbi:hypothetical protein RDI58_000918 [Solanum bulbocastanum]|uniref:Uncharacterized protein n=1 Tax=Solanum bulbocastanum TaxID=147425 RepID=A0AAN8U428_SOLBU
MAMIYKIGNRPQSADLRTTRVKIELAKLLETTNENILSPLRYRLTRCEGFIESYGVRLDNLTATLMRGQLYALRENVDQLRFIDKSMLWGNVPLPDAPASMPPAIPRSEPSQSVQPNRVAEKVEDVFNDDIDEDESAHDYFAKENDEHELRREEDEQRIAVIVME